MKITAAEVNKLRKQTGAGMMDCKNALVENEGDFDKAIDYLRKKGQKIASKRADKETSEGVVIAKTNTEKNFSVVLIISCETDFVAKNQDFIDYVNSVTDVAIKNKPKSIEELKVIDINGRTVEESILDQVGKIGEKMELAGYDFVDAARTFAYNHQGNKLATILGLNKSDGENIDKIGTELAMQVAAMNPIAVDKSDVPQKIIDKEIEIGKEQAIQEGKPEQLIEKIALGKLNKFYKDNTLLNQDFVRESKKTVRQYLAENDKDLTVTSFKRLMLGA
ncbi:MAG: translation elongation factor Ts [Bacteroidales bacterium]|nr:translation elongation factor Ts [Bacteroidales bacterium]